jgi:NADPH-dependent curcumin reductase CurA
MEGFVFTDHARSFPEFYKNMHAMIAEKKLKIVTDERKGLENTGEALRDLFAGKNIGKLCVKL